MKRRLAILPGLLALGVLTLPSAAQGTTEASAEASLVKAYKALDKEFRDARRTFMTAYRKLPESEQNAYYQEHYPQADDYAPRFLELAEAAPRTAVAFDSYLWVVRNAADADLTRTGVEALVMDHIEDERLGEVAIVISGRVQPDQKSEQHLQTILEETIHASVRGLAVYSLGLLHYNRDDYGLGDGTDRVKAEAYFADAMENHADASYRGRPVSELAKSYLFEIRNLAIGQVAPEIEGEDLDGVAFKLSDYRGKVVVLDFWGNW